MPPKKESIYDQYFAITKKYIEEYGEKTILFYKVGAFYEMYGLQKGSQILKSCVYEFTQFAQLNMSGKDISNIEGSIVMAGFRDYSLEKYLKIATDNEYTVIVYDQDTSDTKNITRKLDAIYSPGTYISYDTESSQVLSNNVVCIWLDSHIPYRQTTKQIVCGLSSAHIFTGETSMFEYDTSYIMNPTSFDEIERFISVICPNEVIVVSHLSEKDTNKIIQYTGIDKCALHKIIVDTESNEKKKEKVENSQKQKYIYEILGKYYGEDAYNVCREFHMYSVATQSFCFLLDFLQDHNQNLVRKLTTPTFMNSSRRMVLANHTLKQLNIIDDNSVDGKKTGVYSSVVTFLNKCSTPMGKREFKKQITNPVFDEVWINKEYESIDFLLKEPVELINETRQKMNTLRDLEKIARQLVTKKMYPNTVYLLFNSIKTIQEICVIYESKQHLVDNVFEYKIQHMIDALLEYIDSELIITNCRNIETTNISEPIIRTGKYAKLDELYRVFKKSKDLFHTIHKSFNSIMQQNDDKTEYVKIHETEKSGHSLQITKKRGATLQSILKSLDVINFTDDFVIPVKDIKLIKASSNAESIDFPQLTALLKKTDQIKDQLEKEISQIFAKFLEKLENEQYDNLLGIIKWITRIDVLICKTYIARKYNYCKPEIVDHEKSFFDVKDLRHVLIEHIQENEIYVTNDLELSRGDENTYNGILIYGTNAVGKTSFIRALGICIIMAQSGMYVPCSSFQYKPYESIYSRILGNDNIFKGLSTFAVEMSELRIILKHSDEKSLILGDELCSGTETESALSLFSAGLVELHTKRSTFLFATHFHEITSFEEIQDLKHMGLKHMSVQYDPETHTLLYDRKLKSGQGRRIYGLEVCKSLYMEQDFLELAYSIRNKYFPENGGLLKNGTAKYNAKKIKGICQICQSKSSQEVHHMSPQKDADENGYIGTFHKNHKANLLNLCEDCHDNIHNENKKLEIKKTTKGYEIVSVSELSV